MTALQSEFYVDAAALHRAVAERRSANLQISRRREVQIEGRSIFVHPPEDILLQKLRWFRNGDQRSDRQWRDILGIVRVQVERLDVTYLTTQADVLGVSDLLVRALAAQ